MMMSIYIGLDESESVQRKSREKLVLDFSPVSFFLSGGWVARSFFALTPSSIIYSFNPFSSPSFDSCYGYPTLIPIEFSTIF